MRVAWKRNSTLMGGNFITNCRSWTTVLYFIYGIEWCLCCVVARLNETNMSVCVCVCGVAALYYYITIDRWEL